MGIEEDPVCIFSPTTMTLELFNPGQVHKTRAGQARSRIGRHYQNICTDALHKRQRWKIYFSLCKQAYKRQGSHGYVEAASILKPRYPQAEFHVIGPLWTGNKQIIDGNGKGIE